MVTLAEVRPTGAVDLLMAQVADNELFALLRHLKGDGAWSALGKDLGVPPSTLYSFVNGSRDRRLGTVEAIATGLRMTPQEAMHLYYTPVGTDLRAALGEEFAAMVFDVREAATKRQIAAFLQRRGGGPKE